MFFNNSSSLMSLSQTTLVIHFEGFTPCTQFQYLECQGVHDSRRLPFLQPSFADHPPTSLIMSLISGD